MRKGWWGPVQTKELSGAGWEGEVSDNAGKKKSGWSGVESEGPGTWAL